MGMGMGIRRRRYMVFPRPGADYIAPGKNSEENKKILHCFLLFYTVFKTMKKINNFLTVFCLWRDGIWGNRKVC
jgi:hypothetical protein